MEYLHWDEIKIDDFSDENIAGMYNKGYVFTRIGKGVMQQTRSVRINLSEFKPSSENRRILKKVENVELKIIELPLGTKYHWSLGKTAKDFYEKKFGAGIFSVQKIKELLTDSSASNFNVLFQYGENKGYAICYQSSNASGQNKANERGSIIHYSYPFYNLDAVEDRSVPKDIGLGMMLLAIMSAKDRGLEYIYLGSLQRPTDTYKLQFKGLEWFDGTAWRTDIEKAKEVLA